jgi:hypothetical protein
MSIEKDLTILAVTKMHGGVCTAGIDSEGQWVRPVRSATAKQLQRAVITDRCLLPIDFFHGGQSHLVNLAVTRCWLTSHTPKPPHTEDWTLDVKHKPHLIRKLSREEQARFLANHAEADLSALTSDGARSLGLFQPDRFSFSFGLNKTGEDINVRASFNIGGQEVKDAGCTDLRVRALGRKLLKKSGGANCTLTHQDFLRSGKQATYLAVGLSRLYREKHWPILVGVHSLPELEVEVDYARL